MQSIILSNFDLNKINILFVTTGIILTFFTILTAKNFIKRKSRWYYVLNLVYILSFTFLIFTNNWFIFLTAWEIVTLTTSLMLLWESRKIARQYFIIQFIGSSFLLCVIIVAISYGYSRIGPINEFWLQNLFIFGLGMKSAIFGLHFWLAPVHATAPAPVSAILSGWVVKLGFITMLKLIPSGNNLLIYLGFLMIFYGGIRALIATDYKVLLAFSTISQLGFIGLAIGINTIYGYTGAIFHIIAHGLAKTALFSGSGFWHKEYNTRSIYKFKSPLKKQKFNSLTTIIGSLSLMGIPLLAGYNSKLLVKHAFSNKLILILLHCASIMTYLYISRLLQWVFKDIKLNIKQILFARHKSNYTLTATEKTSLLTPTLILISLGIMPLYLTNIISDLSFNTQLLSGIINTLIYLIITLVILYKLNWLHVAEKKPPSLDNYFKKGFQLIFSFSVKTKEFDPDTIFENFLYQKIYNGSRYLYNKIFLEMQIQLLWIPLFLLLILIWNFIIQ